MSVTAHNLMHVLARTRYTPITDKNNNYCHSRCFREVSTQGLPFRVPVQDEVPRLIPKHRWTRCDTLRDVCV
jgi:hypothetical protein